ncbi:hypothetical protein [Caenispirillum bisanense]|uniref:Uncharacterized protein n=1 Tax=Caenispirillum bisanense TaxID=414052 RepID=A0A286GH29_9PROT|nr:hypothetical protein [Caenispirillum bisanense]SOD94304.1 hypothetical protein SAMN05421508_103457 [Caenispirillum bisanense]
MSDDDLGNRFGQHWLRMSDLLLAELKKRELLDTPEAQAFMTARRRQIRAVKAAEAAGALPAGKGGETKWQAFLRLIGRPPGSTTKH